MALKAGDPAPDFALEDPHGNTVKPSDFRGQKVVVYFYPGQTRRTCVTHKPLSWKDASSHA